MTSRLQSIRYQNPGRFGLNSEVLGQETPDWLSDCDNLIFDDFGSLSGRKAVGNVTAVGSHSSDTEALFEYIQSSTTKEIISAGGLKIYEGTSTLTDKTGTITTPTANAWQFVNFNGKCIGVQQSHTPIVYTGTGNFADITAASGTLPTGNCALSAFGRLWVADSDRTTVKFCGVLDETNWGGAGAGSVDTLQAWPDGVDEVVALAELQGNLLIIGCRSVLIYAGPEDPSATTFQLVDIIRFGTQHRDSVVARGNDVYLMDQDGLKSVRRGVEFDNLPAASVTPHVKRLLAADVDGSDPIRGTYSEELDSLVYTVKSGTRRIWLFDLGSPLQNGGLRALFWDSAPAFDVESVVGTSDGELYFGLIGSIGRYSGYAGTGDASRTVQYTTLQAEWGVTAVKILKSMTLESLTLGAAFTNATIGTFADDEDSPTDSEAFTVGAVTAGRNLATLPVFGHGNMIGFKVSVTSVNAFLSFSGATLHFKRGRTTTYGGGQ